jgi:hypothetical protein
MTGRTLVVASSLLLVACSAAVSPSPSMAPPSETASPTIAATASPSPTPDTGWRRHLVPPLDGVAWINAIAAGEPGLVAVGQGATGQTSWVSSDGITWRGAAVLSDFDAHDLIAGYHHEMVAVGDTVAAGASGASLASAPGRERAGPMLAAACEPGPPLSAAVWTSNDGLHWERLPDDPAFAGVPMLSIVSASQGIGFIALGSNQCNQPDTKPRSASWFSKDGSHWSRDADFEGGLMFDALSDHLAVGVSAETFGCATTAQPLVFSREEIGTPKERAWRAMDPGLGAGYMSEAAVGPDRIVAIARVEASPGDCDGRATVWLSIDGSWSRADLPTGVDITRVHEVESDNASWFLAAGNGGIWGSHDGLKWSRLGGDSDNLLAVGQSAQGLVALGMDPSGAGVAWTGPIALP